MEVEMSMAAYEVHFYKRLLSSDGHSFKCLQQTIQICRAKSFDRAVQAAERKYERSQRVSDWKLRADSLELHCHSYSQRA
jgi:hypothetical protein